MPSNSRKVRMAVTLFLAVSLVACLLTGTAVLGGGGRVYASGEARQIEFTPSVATLQVQQTPQGPTIGALVWTPGMRFDCPVNIREHCRPDLASIHGDDLFGWGELMGSPDLRLVWITDETGTHFLVVSADDPQFAGLADGSSFADVLEARQGQFRYIQERQWEITGSVAAPGALIAGLLLLCPETAGTSCLLAGIAAVATGLANVVRNAGLVASNGFMLGLVIVGASAFLTLVIPREEDRLIAKFGEDYVAYRRTTGRLLPRILRRR